MITLPPLPPFPFSSRRSDTAPQGLVEQLLREGIPPGLALKADAWARSITKSLPGGRPDTIPLSVARRARTWAHSMMRMIQGGGPPL